MTSKAKILASIEELKKQLSDCDCGDECAVFNPAQSERFYAVQQSTDNGVFTTRAEGNHNGRVKNAFRTEQDAKNHAEVFNVLTALRTQEGAIAAKHGVWQYLIEAKTDSSWRGSKVRLEIRKRRDHSVKMSRSFSPSFETVDAAQAAINAVGADRILSAMRTLAQVA